jgi:hypothetical protein
LAAADDATASAASSAIAGLAIGMSLALEHARIFGSRGSAA